MTWRNRVVWSEGMFLRTQHFQQADRFQETLAAKGLQAAAPYLWGLSELRIDEHLLNEGRVGLTAARGAFTDGGHFHAPDEDPLPQPFVVPEDMRDEVLYLCAPTRRPGTTEFAQSEGDPTKRFVSLEIDAPDMVEGGAAYAPIQVAQLNLSVRSASQDLSGFDAIPFARVVERRSDDQVTLDPDFIPTAIAAGAAPRLDRIMSEARGLLHQRGQAIAARLGSASAGGVAEVTDFLLLQAVNRYETLLRHLMSVPGVHPERLYTFLISLAGELATFTEESNRPQEFPAYNHRELTASFEPPLEAIRGSLSAVFEQSAISIPLELRGFGIRVGKIADRSLFENTDFVLAAKAAVDPEALRQLPKRLTIGAVERIRDLVNNQLGGAPVRVLSAEPRQIPYRAGYVYFAINTSHEEWQAVTNSGGIAIHVSGEIPELDIALWAIRGRQ